MPAASVSASASAPLSPTTLARLRRLALGATLALPLVLSACGGDHDDDEDATPVATAPVETPATPDTPETPAEQPEDTRNQAYLTAKAGDIIQVRIEELHPTQDAIGYDQIYYKLGRWQGDFNRPTWAANPTNQLDYLNRTVGKKFDDYCEDMGMSERAADFATIAEAQAARLDDPTTFTCADAPGTNADVLKTVVVGWDGNLYLTDGHHTFSSLREIADGGPKLPVYVKVDANYSDIGTASAFWTRMVDEKKAWLRDGNNQPITADQLPTRVGLPHDSEPGGMSEDKYRSLVYFTRDIAYSNGDLPEFAEFQWGDWLRNQVALGNLQPLTNYRTAAPNTLTQILAVSTLSSALASTGATDSYAAAVRDASLKMSALADNAVVSGTATAAQLGRIQLVAGAASGSPTKTARDTLEELPRNDVKSDGSPRGAGKLWFAANYRSCGKPATGTCWGY
ncbi:ParB/Srx family N-terminal domain-containing protein [Bordetella sp. N]|uniref:ParB/Srx family N-terminal domain-containing protein n=1 Tax=Bordetella sp. N TaxID=1746199 RepID=UPI0007108940|nr:ParB/Srx family N-terminal domain-containing protein [Bordetella sp. N]ALM86589.1 chromosome partitioning protein ParB [Bordetella sp. N]